MKQAISFIFFASLFFLSCKKDSVDQQPDPQSQIQLKTLTVESVSNYFASLGGDVSYDGGELITERGVCWSLNPNPTVKDSSIKVGTGTGIFHVTIYNLVPENRYYARAYAINKNGIAYGNPIGCISNCRIIIVNLRN